MRIAILCGSLEAGRDGVGDYTHGLAVEAARAGHELMTIAIADRFIEKEERGEHESISFHRLPANMSWTPRMERLRKVLNEFNPEWISLQFVPYSFHRRGWVHGLARRLKPLFATPAKDSDGARARSLHIMFHELWLGIGPQAPWKHRIEGLWQRRGVLSFVRTMRPAVVHTSNPTYAQNLQARGVNCEILPLFGNIPLDVPVAARVEAEAWWQKELQAMGVVPTERSEWWLFGVFGSVRREWWLGDIFEPLFHLPSAVRRRLALILFGRPATDGEMVRRFERNFVERVLVHRLGEQPVARISEILRNLDFGIATSPWSIIGKSGTVAAMREHGVPIIVVRTNPQESENSTISPLAKPRLMRLTPELFAHLHEVKRELPCNFRPEIARQWLADLGAC